MKKRFNKTAAVVFSAFLMLLIYMPSAALAADSKYTEEELDYIKENPIVIIAVDPLFHPYEFIDSDGIYKGMAADYLKLIEVDTGLTFQILEGLTWAEAYDMALEGRADLLPCVGITKERKSLFLFTDGYFKYQRAIFSLDSSPVYRQKDLEDITVGVQRNSSHYSYLIGETDIKPVLFDDNESLLNALSLGEIDAMVSNYASTKYTAGQMGITNVKVDQIFDSETSELGMAVNKNKSMLASILNKALSNISEEDKILIRNKWLGIEMKPDYSKVYRYIFFIAPVVIGIILVFVLWNRSLKKNIEERKEAEQKIKLLLESAGDGIIGVDLQGSVNFVNGTALELLGYSETEMLGREVHALIHHSHGDLTEYNNEDCPMTRTYRVGEKHKVHDEVLWRKNGTSFDVEYTSVPIVKNTAIQGAVIVFRDITESKRQQEEIKEALEKVEKLYASSLA